VAFLGSKKTDWCLFDKMPLLQGWGQATVCGLRQTLLWCKREG